jgi:hypothetical protein
MRNTSSRSLHEQKKDTDLLRGKRERRGAPGVYGAQLYLLGCGLAYSKEIEER